MAVQVFSLMRKMMTKKTAAVQRFFYQIYAYNLAV
jgi:hypothetical protein